jgi:GntR family transcriptional repressor for pyruvate dehydrogenase complex
MTDLYELRELLEPSISGLAAERSDELDIQALQEALKSMEASIDDVETFIEADLNFHYALTNAMKNPLVDQLITPIQKLLREQLIEAFNFREVSKSKLTREERITQHKRILDSIQLRDPQGAIDAMQEHLVAVRLRKD